ncbi:MAG: thioredoxin [Tenuifilaceae bacterium]
MSTALMIIGVLILLFVVYTVYTMRKVRNMKEVPDSNKIVTLTKANFDHQVKNGVVLIDFWAGWCMPCKMLAPIINEVAEEANGSAKIGKLNVEEQREIAAKYSVRSIPTILLLKNGKEVNRFVGVKTKDFLLKQIMKVQ